MEKIAEFRSIDIVLTPCGEYGSFCCGQNKDARACCDANSTEQVGTGEIVTSSLPAAAPTSSGTNNTLTTTPTACPDNGSVQANGNAWKPALIALTAVLGCAVLASMVFFWLKKRDWESKKSDWDAKKSDWESKKMDWESEKRDWESQRRVAEEEINALNKRIEALRARPPSPPME